MPNRPAAGSKVITITLTNEHAEFLKEKCIDKSRLFRDLIDMRMGEKVLKL